MKDGERIIHICIAVLVVATVLYLLIQLIRVGGLW